MAAAKPRRIMLATDLTPAGDRAFDRAAQLGDEWNAELTICHVVESSSARPWGMDRRLRNAETEMDRLIRSGRVSRRLGRHIIAGDPGDRALEHAHQIGCDFLVTGPAHGKILGDQLLGSTAAPIVRRATQPTLAVRRRPEGVYRSIVSVVDFSKAAQAALRRGRELFPSARLTVLHAYRLSPNWGGPNADKSVDEIEADERARVVEAATRGMSALLAAMPRAASSIETAFVEGEPGEVVAQYVGTNWPDLVIAGTHGQRGLQQDSVGSVAELFLTSLPCDVLAVPVRH